MSEYGEYIYCAEVDMTLYPYSTHITRKDEIVRCKDCKHFGIVSETCDCDPIYGCCKLSFSNAPITSELQEPQDEYGFCAWGERKDT